MIKNILSATPAVGGRLGKNTREILLLAIAVPAVLFTAQKANAVVPTEDAGSAQLAYWSFEGLASPFTSDAGPAATGTLANTTPGGSDASGSHANATTYSAPAGNGSAKSFSSNGWTVGDYYQFKLSTVTTNPTTDVYVLFGQVGSSTGPRDFKLAYSLDGTSFTDFASYTVPLADWTATTTRSTGLQSFNLSAIDTIENQPTVYFRLIDTSTTPISSGTSVATTGSDRVDDFTVSAGSAAFAIPEPSAAVALFGGIGMLVGFRRMRRTA